MAYVSKEKKAKIKAALDKVVPNTWTWSLAVRHHSTIVLTISKGPKELAIVPSSGFYPDGLPRTETRVEYRSINQYHLDTQFISPELTKTMKAVLSALNTDNFDASDSQTDYFHVGHYVDIRIGRWDKPFVSYEMATLSKVT